MDAIEKIRAIIKRQIKREEFNFRALGGGGQTFCINTLEWVLKQLDTIEEEPVKGLDVTDFCKPIDPGIAQCIADHSWEMLGEEPVIEELEEAAWNCVLDSVDVNNPVLLPKYKELLLHLFRAGANWQYQKDRGEFAKIKAKTWCEGFDAHKEQMMKDVVEGKIYGYDDGSFELIASWLDLPKESKFKDGEKVKLIIVKEDEK